MPYVFVQEEGALGPLEQWFVSSSAPKEAKAWERVCGLIVSRAIERLSTPLLNVFFVFDGEELVDRDRPALRTLIAQARARTWGARLILVLSNAPLIHLIDRSAAVDLTEWLAESLTGKVADLIQVTEQMNVRSPQPLFRALRDAASAVRARQKVIFSSTSPRRWRCALPDGWFHLSELLGADFVLPAQPEKTFDLVIVVPAGTPERQKTEVEKHVSTGDGDSRYLVVTHKHEPSLSLQQYCSEKGLRPPISVGGEFELWYLLLRLNEHARDDGGENSYSVHPVPLVASPRLKVVEPETAPSLLVTSVFDHSDMGQCLLAASEVGEILHRIPFGIRRRIELGVTPDRLSGILEDMQMVSVWIHIGHGDSRNGLRVPGDGDVDVEKWLHCFKGRDLRLALFLTCHSALAAKRFAQEGASVAIGFEGDVESDKTWHLAVEVVKAIVAEGTRGASILAGFSAGLPRFEAVQKLDARARAYYPRTI